ncbi:MAG: hypothetical protein CBD16_05150 [Betaproteobacteria bacterium TMED156]|nr:MAG: hypothetical protein CBD16_05150 [Betaproteobacteria bacterium TMED156]
MALNLRGGAAPDPFDNHQERKRYKAFMDEIKKVYSVIDTLYSEKHYGFLNTNYQVIQPISGIGTINFGSFAPEVFGLNFVVDQFTQFRDFYIDFSRETGLRPPSLINNLTPGKSFQNFDENYQNSLKALTLRMSEELEKVILSPKKGTMLSPVEFYQHFNEEILFLPKMESYSISKSGYAISSNSSCYETGLYVDMAENISTDLDYEKGKMIDDPGFLCYVKFANEYGFSIDFNAPWRMIFNLNHEKSRENILNGRPLEDFWHFYYDQYVELTGFSYDYYNIREFYENLYKTYYRRYNRLTSSEMSSLSWRQIYTDLFSRSLRSTRYGPGQFWVETFTLNRLREVGMIKKYTDFDEHDGVLAVRDHALELYGREENPRPGIYVENPISTGIVGQPDSGVAAYITSVSGQFLKRKMENLDQ